MNKVKWVTAFDYWVLGIPISLYMMFRANLHIEGLWYGPTVAVLMNYIWYTYVIHFTDWQEIADKTAKKLKDDMQEMNNSA
jgi:Na+-driven multidrug efflux pump